MRAYNVIVRIIARDDLEGGALERREKAGDSYALNIYPHK